MLQQNFQNKNPYIINLLNKNSLFLAESICRADKNACIIIAGDIDPADSKQVTDAQNSGYLVTSESVLTVALKNLRSSKKVRFVLMHPEEEINLDQALKLTNMLRGKMYAEIYTVNTSKVSECLIDSIDKGSPDSEVPPIKLRRVNLVRNQVYLDILNNSIFENPVLEYNEKIICVLIAGLGQYGMEMLKAILWCAQMDGYVLRAHIIDKNPDIESVFYRHCPGIRQRGTQPKSGEDYYELNFHGGIDVNSIDFDDCVRSIASVSLAFVALGNENINLETAIRLRSLFSGIKIDNGEMPEHSRETKQNPRILTVIQHPEKASLIKENRLSNFKNEYYQLDCIGSASDMFSYENIFMPQLEAMALKSHLQLGSETDFNNYEYNRRSSMASVIHKKYRDMLMPDNETKDIVEHRRWNAYMRGTEGYSFGFIRDDLALRHPLLVKYDNLGRVEKDKDLNMNSDNISTIF